MAFIQPPGTAAPPDYHSLARRQEILLDILALECARNGTVKFLMKDRYHHGLSPEEIEMKNFLRQVAKDYNKYRSC